MIYTVKKLDIHQWKERAEQAEADRDKIREAASWLLANRGHRGEQQAWKLLQDALVDSQ